MKYIITRYKRETRMYKTVLEARLWNITRLDILSRYISFTSFSDTIRCIWIYPPPCSTIRLWNLREEIYISFSIFIIKMYIYVYFHRSATRNTYCVTTHQPPPPPHSSLYLPPRLHRICRKCWHTRACSFVRGEGNTWFVICVQRRGHIFSYSSTPPYIHP